MEQIAKISNYSYAKYSIDVHPLRKTLRVGDILIIEFVEAIKRALPHPLGYCRQFIVTAKAKRSDRKIHIYPGIVSSGKYKTVTRRPSPGSFVYRIQKVRMRGRRMARQVVGEAKPIGKPFP